MIHLALQHLHAGGRHDLSREPFWLSILMPTGPVSRLKYVKYRMALDCTCLLGSSLTCSSNRLTRLFTRVSNLPTTQTLPPLALELLGTKS